MKHKLFQDTIDFARIGKKTHRVLRSKKTLSNKSYKRMIKKIRKGWR